ncbi:MAG: asparagine synthase-related protein [Candidatus Hodarchaeota archaeon]
MCSDVNVIISTDGEGKKWCKVANPEMGSHVYACGYGFLNGQLFRGKSLARVLLEAFDSFDRSEVVDGITGSLKSFDGFFSIVYERKGVCVGIVDRVRSIPLFFCEGNDSFSISNNPHLLSKGETQFEFNKDAVLEFVLAGYVTGSDTLNLNISQISPGNMVVAQWDRSRLWVTRVEYFNYYSDDILDWSDEDLEHQLYLRLENVFNRYARWFCKKKVLVPLSGGLDSRLIVAMLKKAGIDDVVCFSYGNPMNKETTLSRKIACVLGYKWIFIPYEGWEYWNALSHNEFFQAYRSYGSAFSSIAHFQDWPAVRVLVEKFEDGDVVFVPGHTGDFLSGGHIPDELIVKKRCDDFYNLVAESIYAHHYNLWPLSKNHSELRGRIIRRIKNNLKKRPIDKSSVVKCYEAWEWAGRQARYIVNSVRVYDYFGKDWALPLWENELMSFFMKLEVEAKYQKRIYINTLCNKIFRGELSKLSEIPVFSTTRLAYRKKGDPVGRSRGIRRAVPILVKVPGISWILVMVMNYKNDVFRMYGSFMKEGNQIGLLRRASSVLPAFDEKMDPEIRCILVPALRKPILMNSLRGLSAVRHVLALTQP